MNKVLVTGSSGFVAHWLVRALKKRGYYVIGVDNLSDGLPEYAKDCNEFHEKDILDLTPKDFTKVKYVFHLAALPKINTSWDRPVETNKVNVEGTLNLLECARNAGVEKLIYSSSSSVYGEQPHWLLSEETTPHPVSPYAVQKLAAEYYCEVYRKAKLVKTVSLRYFNVFGEEQKADNPYTGVLTRFLDLKKKGEPLTIYGDGKQTRDFTYVGDVVEANIMAAEANTEGVFNIGSGARYSINEVAKMIGGKVKHLPPRPNEVTHTLAYITKAQMSFGWEPKVSIKSWIQKYG